MRVFQTFQNSICQLTEALYGSGSHSTFLLKKSFVPPPEMPVDRRPLVRKPCLVTLRIVKGSAGSYPDINQSFDFGEELFF